MAAPVVVVKAAAMVLANPRTVRWLAAAIALLAAIPIAIVLIGGAIAGGLVQSVFGQGATGRVPGEIAPGQSIPADLFPVYADAEHALGVNRFLLAAVHKQETSFNQNAATFTVNSSGCAGPMQIGVGGRCGCTWCNPVVQDAYRSGVRPLGYRGAHEPHPSVYDTYDAVMAAAMVLRNKVRGAPIPNLDKRAHAALCGYYGACADASSDYADVVLANARAYQAEGAAPAIAQGGAREIVDTGAEIAARYGLIVISALRPGAVVYGSGRVSNHCENSANRAARDVSNGHYPTPEMDAAVEAIARAFGTSVNGRSEIVTSWEWHGYKLELLYRTDTGGNHFNHVHFGAHAIGYEGCVSGP